MSKRSLLLPSLALVAGAGTAHAVDLDFQIHGFASQGYVETSGEAYLGGWYGRDTNQAGTFEFNEFAVNVVATPIERLRIGAQFIAYDLGHYGNNEVQIDWAFGEYAIPLTSDLDLSVVAGRFKTGHAFYNDYRDLDMTRTSVFLPRSVYSASFRDLFLAANGAQLNSSYSAGALGSFVLSGFLGTQNLEEDEGPIRDVFASGARQSVNIGVGFLTTELKHFDYIRLQNFNGGHFEWTTPLDGLRLKLSSLYADNMEASGTMTARLPVSGALGASSGTSTETDIDIVVDHWFDVTVGAEYMWGDLTVASEFTSQYYRAKSITGALDFPPFGNTPGIDQPARVTDLANRNTGIYGAATYQLAFLPGAWNRLSVYGAFSWDRSENPLSGAGSYTRAGAVAMRYDIVEHFLLKAEFERVQETSSTNVRAYGNIFSLKTTFDF
jgi:hypothetical protein